MGVCRNQMNGIMTDFALIVHMTKQKKARNKMSKKEYEHGDHMAVMSELLVLYKLKNETEQKINVANEKNERLKKLLKEKEADESPF